VFAYMARKKYKRDSTISTPKFENMFDVLDPIERQSDEAVLCQCPCSVASGHRKLSPSEGMTRDLDKIRPQPCGVLISSFSTTMSSKAVLSLSINAEF